jgi:aldehyde:ferredoxin oxidoreductase
LVSLLNPTTYKNWGNISGGGTEGRDMARFDFGYGGKILKVDLSSHEVHSEPLSEDTVHNFIGGRGLTSSILLNEMDPGTEVYSDRNLLVFAIGPLTGSGVPASCRFVVASKSPVTGILGDGNAGGYWGPELKFAGYDAIVVRGKSDHPVYLWIQDDSVEIREARPIWGKYTSDTEQAIREELGDPKIRIASIGPAGENLVNYACVIADLHHSASRCGIGAVMGSKNLKAIAVRGTKGLQIKDPSALAKTTQELRVIIKEDPAMRLFKEQGSAKYVLGSNSYGGLPTRNYQTGFFEGAENIGGPAFSKLKTRNEGCFRCPVQCDGYCEIPEGHFKGTYIVPELVAIHSLGSGCGNDHIESIIYANDLCNKLGLDVASTGRTISFILECNQRGLLPPDLKAHYHLEWGDYLEEIRLIEEIAYRQGIGDLLSLGSFKASKIIGRGSEKYSMHSKGLELDAVDPRTYQGYGLGFATSTRGACHLRALAIDRYWTNELAEKMFGVPEISDETSTKGKGPLVKWSEDLSSLINSLGICIRVYNESSMVFSMKKIDLIPAMFAYVTGIHKTKEELFKCGERITNVEKLFNLREGCGKEWDTLPKRFLEEPLPVGPLKGQVHHLNSMIQQYYMARGWDVETSVPKKEKLRDLGLDKYTGTSVEGREDKEDGEDEESKGRV